VALVSVASNGAATPNAATTALPAAERYQFPDPQCARGTVSPTGKACCPASCKKCNSRQTGDCNPTTARAYGDCDERQAPCSLQKMGAWGKRTNTRTAATPNTATTALTAPGTPDPQCANGVASSNDAACCPASCKACNSKQTGDCNPKTARAYGDCDEREAPCSLIKMGAWGRRTSTRDSAAPAEWKEDRCKLFQGGTDPVQTNDAGVSTGPRPTCDPGTQGPPHGIWPGTYSNVYYTGFTDAQHRPISNFKKYPLSDGPSACAKTCVGDCKYIVWVPNQATYINKRRGRVVDHHLCFTFKACPIKWNAGFNDFWGDAVGYKADCE